MGQCMQVPELTWKPGDPDVLPEIPTCDHPECDYPTTEVPAEPRSEAEVTEAVDRYLDLLPNKIERN